MINVIGISGKAGTGKDHISQQFLRPLGYHQYSLSWHFKVDIVGKGLASYQDVFFNKPPEVRRMLQQMGTEEGRMKYGEDVWLDHAYTWMTLFEETWGINKFVIADIRFPNEVKFIQKHGGKVLRIDAPLRAMKSNLSIEARLHSSETALDLFTEFDEVIHNDPQYADSIESQISVILNVPQMLMPTP